MKITKLPLNITSPESLDAAVAEVVRMKIQLVAVKAEMETAKAEIEKAYAARIALMGDAIAKREESAQDYCAAHRETLFAGRKSRETLTALIGFELTPPRVETTGRKVTWREVVKRLSRLEWGRAYIRQPEPQPDKTALLADRQRLTQEQCNAAGIVFAQDEQFFIRPRSEVAEATVRAAA